MMPGREMTTGRERKPAPTPPTLGRDQSPGRISSQMPGCPAVIAWALSLALLLGPCPLPCLGLGLL